MDIMLGTRLRAGITIEIRMRPRPMYAFRVILLMPRYAYAAYPTVLFFCMSFAGGRLQHVIADQQR
jgi:hypothetical protein